MSLYRTYRPQNFADVIGQDHVVTTLEQAVKQDKIAHAFLFAGSRGTGKTSVARILAKVIMTQGMEDEALRNQVIKGVEEGSIVDLLEIDAASNTGVDNIRDLIEKIQFSPVAATAKVYIIDEVHMLSKGAFNALLKTLEEPPAYAYFILATTELNKIPATIQSRCQCFPFRRIRDEDIIRRLQYIADTEKITVERDALRSIARHVEGGMRDAISLLDQLRSLESISIADVEERIGSTGHEYVASVFEAINANDQKALVETIHKIEEAGIPLDVFTRQLLGVIRTQLHESVEAGNGAGSYVRILDVLLDAIRDIRSAPLPGLVLESALLSLCTSNDKAETKVVIETPKVEKEAPKETAEKQTEEKVEKPQEETSAEEEQTDSLQEAIVEAIDLTEENVLAEWPKVVKDVQPASVRMSLKDAQVQGIDGNTINLGFSSAFHRDKVSDTKALHTVEEVAKKVFRQNVRVHCDIKRESDAVAPSGTEVNLAEAAAEIF